MRAYPRNSPHAALRILALTLLADGHLSRTELDALLRQQAADPALHVPAADLHLLLQHLTEDLLATGAGPWGTGGIDPGTVASAFDEVDDPALRDGLLARCAVVASADDHVSDGESAFLGLLQRRWGAQGSAA
jgi:hypothetical protein